MSDLPNISPTRQLGQSGIEVTSMAWGMWRFAGRDVAEAARLVHAVLDCGITLFDTADIYGFNGTDGFGDAESLFGEVLSKDKGLRDRMIVASKGGIMLPLPYDSSAAYLETAIDATLSRLALDTIALWQIHRPDILAHPQETARALEKAVQSGKIQCVGVSNFTQSQIAALNHFLDQPIVSTQPEISALRIDPMENGELDQAMVMDMTPLAWSPLAGGRIASPDDDRAQAVAKELDRIAETFGISRAATAYSWIMAHPSRPIPIIGSQRADRVADAMDAMTVQWNRQDWYAVLVAARGVPLP
ncbi:aldo/keto reductase [Parasphingorhabdus cellanae]|uniref:Aldo/keto reductase n=1 Tax=Parasphingorhabdus cellanae TaxID=2806553 RepID=A0ABX7T114_9SPHN|nr:aldo/keto reductase [Parasphingorhabdus cellanae]QTD55246.1 aldo/keto reductase [Parasphingorhabdus cellanae]